MCTFTTCDILTNRSLNYINSNRQIPIYTGIRNFQAFYWCSGALYMLSLRSSGSGGTSYQNERGVEISKCKLHRIDNNTTTNIITKKW